MVLRAASRRLISRHELFQLSMFDELGGSPPRTGDVLASTYEWRPPVAVQQTFTPQPVPEKEILGSDWLVDGSYPLHLRGTPTKQFYDRASLLRDVALCGVVRRASCLGHLHPSPAIGKAYWRWPEHHGDTALLHFDSTQNT